MSKFCTNCGTQLEDDVKFCTACGTASEGAEVAPAESTPIIDESAPTWQKKLFDFIGKLKADKKLLGLVCGGAVAGLAVLIAVSVLLSAPAYKNAIDSYLDVWFFGDVNSVEELAPEAFWEWAEEEHDISIDDILDSFDDEFAEGRMEELEEEYGKNIKLSYEILNERELSAKKVSEMAETLKDYYGIPRKSVTAAYKLDVELTIGGSEDEYSDESELYVVKIDGDWYICGESGYLLVASVVSTK